MPDLMERCDEVVSSIVRASVSALPDEALRDEAIAIGTQIRRLEAARAARVREVELRGCQVDEAARHGRVLAAGPDQHEPARG